MQHTLAIVFIIVAVIGAAIGGVLDVMGHDSFLGISKAHFWSDSVFILVLALVVMTWPGAENKQAVK